LRARRAWQSRCWFEIASSLKAPRNDPLGANVNYNVLLVISSTSGHAKLGSASNEING